MSSASLSGSAKRRQENSSHDAGLWRRGFRWWRFTLQHARDRRKVARCNLRSCRLVCVESGQRQWRQTMHRNQAIQTHIRTASLPVGAIILIIHLMLRHGLHHFATIHASGLRLGDHRRMSGNLYKQAEGTAEQGKVGGPAHAQFVGLLLQISNDRAMSIDDMFQCSCCWH